MHFIAEWSANQGRNLIYIHPSVIEVLQRHIQSGPADLEGGGLLLGYVRGAHLEIIEATEPTRFDRRFRAFFERMRNLHEYIAHKRWTESEGLIRYIGEWHTHPQNYPSPSGTDLIEWQKLALKRKDNRPVLGLIVGRKSLYLECMPSSGEGTKFCPIDGH